MKIHIANNTCTLGTAYVGSRKAMKMLDPKEAEQLILNQMDHNAARHQSPRTIRHKIAMRTGQHLMHDYITKTMHIHDDAGFNKCDPTAKHIHHEPKVPIGINEWWSADGHDKLNGIGFPIWVIVDDTTGRWLGIWVMPSNRLGNIIVFLYLEAMERVGGKYFLQFFSLNVVDILQGCLFKAQPTAVQRQHSCMVLRKRYGEFHHSSLTCYILMFSPK